MTKSEPYIMKNGYILEPKEVCSVFIKPGPMKAGGSIPRVKD